MGACGVPERHGSVFGIIDEVTIEERLSVAFHEAGHAAMIFWRRESLHDRPIVLHNDRYGGSVLIQLNESNESDLMVLISGHMAQLLAMGVVPKVPIRHCSS
jgi:hypothetical protein